MLTVQFTSSYCSKTTLCQSTSFHRNKPVLSCSHSLWELKFEYLRICERFNTSILRDWLLSYPPFQSYQDIYIYIAFHFRCLFSLAMQTKAYCGVGTWACFHDLGNKVLYVDLLVRLAVPLCIFVMQFTAIVLNTSLRCLRCWTVYFHSHIGFIRTHMSGVNVTGNFGLAYLFCGYLFCM